MRRWLFRLRSYWPAVAEAAPSALGGIAMVVVAALVVLLVGFVLASATTLLY